MTGERPFLRDNAFLVAAVLLPLLVVGFFLLASAVPRWTVPPPAYDVLMRGYRPYEGDRRLKVAYDLELRNGTLQLTVRPLAADAYMQKPALFVFNHQTLAAREISLTLPEVPPETPQTTIIDPAPGHRLIAEPKAPDGYVMEPRPYHGGGLFGDVFGMHGYQSGMVLVNRGRVIPVVLPEPFQSQSSAYFLAWVAND